MEVLKEFMNKIRLDLDKSTYYIYLSFIRSSNIWLQVVLPGQSGPRQ